MQRAISTLGCAELSLEEAAALAARYRVDAIEVRALGGTLDLPRYLADRYGTPAAFAAAVAVTGVRVAALDTSFRLIDANPDDFEALLAFVPWAEAAGVRWLRVFDGGRKASDSELAEGGERVRAWQALRRARGWQVDWMVETHDALITAAAIRRFVHVAPDCGILWDAHHTWRKGGEAPLATWSAIAPHVVHVHVKDSIGRPSARHPFTYVPPGEGEFPMADLRDTLAREFSGFVSLEWERQWHPYLPSLETALRTASERSWW